MPKKVKNKEGVHTIIYFKQLFYSVVFFNIFN